MKYCILIIAFLQIYSAEAQQQNNEEVTVNNYRSHQAFNQNINALNPDYALFDACMSFAINEQRAKNHLSILPWHTALETSSFYHSKQMAQYHFFSNYNNLDEMRLTAEKRGELAGIINPLLGECIAKMSLTKPSYLEMCDEFVKLWMNSPPHRKIILSDNANAIGIGFYFSDTLDIYATLDVQCYRILVFNAANAKDRLPFNSQFE